MDQELKDLLGEIEVFLRMIARMSSADFNQQKLEIGEAATVFADQLDDALQNLP